MPAKPHGGSSRRARFAKFGKRPPAPSDSSAATTPAASGAPAAAAPGKHAGAREGKIKGGKKGKHSQHSPASALAPAPVPASAEAPVLPGALSFTARALLAALTLAQPLQVPAATAAALVAFSEVAPQATSTPVSASDTAAAAAAASNAAATGQGKGKMGAGDVKEAAKALKMTGMSSIFANLGLAPPPPLATTSSSSSGSKTAKSSAPTPVLSISSSSSSSSSSDVSGPFASFSPAAAAVLTPFADSPSDTSAAAAAAPGSSAPNAPWPLDTRRALTSELARAAAVHALYRTFRDKTDKFVRRNAFNEFEGWILSVRSHAAATATGVDVLEGRQGAGAGTKVRAAAVVVGRELAAQAQQQAQAQAQAQEQGKGLGKGKGHSEATSLQTGKSFVKATGLPLLFRPTAALQDPLLPSPDAVATDVHLGKRLIAAGATPEHAAYVCKVLASKAADAIALAKSGGSYATSKGIVKVCYYSFSLFNQQLFLIYIYLYQ